MSKKQIVKMKDWWMSKTIWINVLILMGGISTAMIGELQSGSVISFLSIANIFLRIITSEKLVWRV